MGGYVSVRGSKGSSFSSIESNRKTTTYSPLKQVISLLEELDTKREIVIKKEQELETAKQNLNVAEKQVQLKLGSLDPSTRELIKGMLEQIDGKDPESLTQDETKGRIR